MNSVAMTVTDSAPWNVLVVDDDPAILNLLDRYLTRAGYRVHKATDGDEALQIMRQEGPALVVVDWMMPQMDGLTFCQTIRSAEWAGRVYIVVLTGHFTEDLLVKALEAGADEFVAKPVRHRELIARLRVGQRMISLQKDLDAQRIELHRYCAELAIASEKLQVMATTDELTGLLNRREAMKRLKECWATAERYNDPLTLIMTDVDHFKKVNDTHGHAIGDLVLKMVSTTLRQNVRISDAVCRMGGEEFLVICPRTNAEGACVVAERIRNALLKQSVPIENSTLTVTASLGVAENLKFPASIDALLQASDDALYDAKRSGRNRVAVASQATPVSTSVAEPSPQLLVQT